MLGNTLLKRVHEQLGEYTNMMTYNTARTYNFNMKVWS